ncbi:MAG TPA: VanZ family protein, partial [Desulfosarcina sp.]|nr:VanZ family protein [Desulfosarcina sp.]
MPWTLLLLTAAMLLLILYFGLRFKGAAITNDVAWLEGTPGIRFVRSGMVYAEPVGLYHGPREATAPSLTIELALKSAAAGDGHFQFVLLLHGGKDAGQLVIGQWRSWLIVMNGDDYDARRRRPRVAVNALQPGKERFVTIVSGEDGTAVYLEGRLAKRNPELKLQIPEMGSRGRLVIGNSVYGRHAWTGEFYGLAHYHRALEADTIHRHEKQWRRTNSFAYAADAHPAGLYLFDEKQGAEIADHSGRSNHLRIPARMTLLTKEFLTAPFVNEGNRPSLLQDMVINLVGFIPLGFLLSALMCHDHCRPLQIRLAWVALTCGAVSLAIELTQAWIPTRSSQMLDLILNTLGGGAGVLLHAAFQSILLSKSKKPKGSGLHT